MSSIRPMSDLRNNTTEIAELAHAEKEVIITKNGYADLVVMSFEAYERNFARLEVYDKLAKSQREVDTGAKLLSVRDVFEKYKAKYGAE
ncbi:MAG: type II toxin-antitoxin system Phd/YefM family antitoxin [Firmicutes bacterium]|nr:type II toxin-antitoxin system Phd/YefM family antitoxin [Bacillota bacterium]